MFVCPDCKNQLANLICSQCKIQYPEQDGIPILMSRDKKYADAKVIAEIYDNNFYTNGGTWYEQGFDEEYMTYVLQLIPNLDQNNGRFLDIACGDGTLLKLVPTNLKFGIDLSLNALKLAQKKTNAFLCVSLGERLPFPSDYFHAVANIGSLEHFLNDAAGVEEMFRVLKQGGYSLVVVPNKGYHKSWNYAKHIINKYFYPQLRPSLFMQKMLGKILRKIRRTPKYPTDIQPIVREYSLGQAKRLFHQTGFEILNILPHEIVRSPNKRLSLRFTFHFIFLLRKSG